MTIPQNQIQYPWMPPPQEWQGHWPTGAYPTSFPQPPPMPPNFAYGNRAWMSGRWAAAPAGVYYPGRPNQSRKASSAEYWATKLVDNPLGLQNMIPADQIAANAAADAAKATAIKKPEVPNQTQDHNLVWVPALTDEHPRGRVHQRTVSKESRSSSQPARREVREPSPLPPLPVPPLTPYQPGVELFKEPPSARKRPISSAAYDRRVEEAKAANARQRLPSGRMSVPPQAGRDRFGTMPWAFAPSSAPAHPASFNVQRPGIDSDSDTTATATQRPQSRGMAQTRSYTLPPEDGQRRHPHHDYYTPTHGRRNSTTTGGGGAIQRSQTMPPELSYPMPSHVQTTTAQHSRPSPVHDTFRQRQEYSSKNIHSVPREANAPYTFAPRMPTPEPEEGEFEPPDPASVERVRKWLAKNETMNRASPTIRRTVDMNGHDGVLADGRSPLKMQPYSARRTDDPSRSASLPAVIPNVGQRAVFSAKPSMFSDEPTEMTHGVAAAHINESDYLGPNDLPTRGKGLDRSDTLIIEDNFDHRESLLPSPMSLNRTKTSSRGSGGRSSFDQGLGQQANFQPSPRPSLTSGESRHVSPTNSTHFQQANGVGNKVNYNTPPITPNRTGHTNHQESRGLYSMSNAAGSRSNVSSNNPHATPYRHADPPHQRPPSVQPSPSAYQSNPRRHQHLYQQEGASSSSLSLSNNGLSRQSSQRHRPSTPHHPPADDNHIYSAQRATGSGRSSEELRSSTPNRDAREQPQQIYSRPTNHHVTPAKGAIIPTSSPSYGRAQLQNGRHNSPVMPKRRITRNVRRGLWNRRGDHLTPDGFVVFCPPGRNFPKDLVDYPENAFRDHTGKVVHERPESHPEHPDSIPSGLRPPTKPYDTFIDYVLVED